MASAKQIAANQANSKKSTGPRTLAGKQVSRLNAVSHGLSGQTLLRTPEEAATFNAYSARLMPDLSPANDIELDFAERIVFDSWRVRKAGVIEQNLFALADATFDTGNPEDDDALNQAAAFDAHQKTINLISLYQQRLERAMHKNLDMLRRMQKERRAEAEKAAKQAALAAKPSLQVVEKPAASPLNCFVSSAPPPEPASPPLATQNDSQNLAA